MWIVVHAQKSDSIQWLKEWKKEKKFQRKKNSMNNKYKQLSISHHVHTGTLGNLGKKQST